MANRQQRRQGKPQGVSYAQKLARDRMLTEAAQNAANDTMVNIKADIQAQKTQWITMLALNDADGYGKTKYERLAKAIIKRSEWYEELIKGADEEYANEKLRREVERVSKQEVEFAWEEEIREAKKKHENDILTNYERLWKNGKKGMAIFLCELIPCDRCPGQSLCSHKDGKANGLLKWLDQLEVRECSAST